MRLGNIIKLKSINSFIKTVTDAFETHILYGKPGQANCYITVFEIWKTPGHSDESKCFLLPGSIFVGDLMFAGSVGRANPKCWARHREFVNQVLTLENDTYIFPGHGPVTTVKTEKKINPFYELEAK